jgi:osmoprotectant transport system substrate-binding protein
LAVPVRSTVTLLAALLTLALLSGCGRDDPPADQVKGTLVVGSGTTPEAKLIGEMYSLALAKAGYQVTDRTGEGERGVYLRSLQQGSVDLVPDDLSGLTTWFDVETNGPAAAAAHPVASGDPARTLTGLRTLLRGRPLALGTLSPARHQVSFAVTKELADREDLRSVSDLSRLPGQLVLGGPADCPVRPNCLPGLSRVYGVTVKDFRPLGPVSGTPILDALDDDTVQVGMVLSSAGGVAEKNLVVLVDDRGLQDAGNLLAVYRDSVPAEVRAVVEKVNQALTTEKLQELNKKLDPDGADPGDLAKMFLRDAGLV